MKYKVALGLFFMIHLVYSQSTNKDVVAKIKTEQVDDVIVISGEATNASEVYKSLKFIFSVFETDAEGKISKTNQEGRFTLETNEQKKVASSIIDIDKSDKIVILLLVYEDDQIVGKDRIVFKESSKEVEVDGEEEEDGIELKGIVIEKTKTKPGKDFYEFFYNSYSLNNINGSKVVGVYEKLSFGRSTIIQVKVEDQLIMEFLGKPDLEYLEQMSKNAIRKVYQYFKDLKNQKDAIFQY